MKEIVRSPNTFERILLLIGVAVIMVGYGLIHATAIRDGFGWPFVQSLFMWLILTSIIILLAVTENVKEELKQVINMQVKEMRFIEEELAAQQHTMSRKF